MFCSKCGNQVPEGSMFCPACGTQMRQVVQPMRPAQQTQQPQSAYVRQQTQTTPAYSTATRSGGGKAKVIISIAIAAIVIAAALIVGSATSWFGLAGTGAQAPTGTAADLPVQTSVDGYSWDELSAISKEISASGSEDAALQVAKKYNLCTSDGRLDGTQVKSLTLSDGTQASVQIVGFYHDDTSDGSGKAGITFIFKDAVTEREMNPRTDTNQYGNNSGGWRDSEMRGWLSTDFTAMLPADLSKDIVTVDKRTNNTGYTDATSSVTVTQDAVWLFSTVELCGSTDWFGDAHDDVLNAEGAEYQLFSDSGVLGGDSNEILTKTYLPSSSASGNYAQGGICDWWGRSPYPTDSSYFCGVGSYGNPTSFADSDYTRGVVPGFCI